MLELVKHNSANLPRHQLGICLLLCLLCGAFAASAQFTISGTVLDSSKIYPISGVLVKSTAGTMAKTDSLGHYDIVASDNDSLVFTYHNKPTEKFPISQIQDIGNFDISLRVQATDKVKMLKEVIVYSRTYHQDSVENREEYSDVFDYERPGIKTTTSSYSGAAGMDLDEFINIFKFGKNKEMRSFQKRLIEEEQDKYIDYRFNKTLVKRMTKIQEPDLDSFMVKYRPDFIFTQTASTIEFYQYILDASYEFKREQLQKAAPPADTKILNK